MKISNKLFTSSATVLLLATAASSLAPVVSATMNSAAKITATSQVKAPAKTEMQAQKAADKLAKADKLPAPSAFSVKTSALADGTLYHFTFSNPAYKGAVITVAADSKGNLEQAAKLDNSLKLPSKIEAIAKAAANHTMSKYYKKASATYSTSSETAMADGTLYHVTFTSKAWVKGSSVTVTVNSKGQVVNQKTFLPAD